jgi:hypothetical protein
MIIPCGQAQALLCYGQHLLGLLVAAAATVMKQHMNGQEGLPHLLSPACNEIA